MVKADKWPIGSLLAATLHDSFLARGFPLRFKDGMLSTKNAEFHPNNVLKSASAAFGLLYKF